MKRLYILFIVFGFALAFSACESELDGDLGPGDPFSKLEGISDDWRLIQMGHADIEDASGNVGESITLPDVFIGGTPATLNFTKEGTFSGSAGSSKILFPISGTWAFDDDDYPAKVFLTSGGETVQLDLLAPIRERVDNFLHFMYVRPYGDCSPNGAGARGTVGYEYKFERQ